RRRALSSSHWRGPGAWAAQSWPEHRCYGNGAGRRRGIGMTWPVCRLALAGWALLKHSETSTAPAREGSGKALIFEKRMVPVKACVVTSGCARSEASASGTRPVTWMSTSVAPVALVFGAQNSEQEVLGRDHRRGLPGPTGIQAPA